MIGHARAHRPGLFLAVLLLGGCISNSAPGNDRESQLDPPAPAAEMVSAAEMMAGVDAGLLIPAVLTDADRAGLSGECIFRMTRVGLPAAVYGAGGATLKMNGRRFTLPASAEGEFGEAGLQASIHPIEESADQFPAEMVVRIPGRDHELGFRGFASCFPGA